MAVAALHTGRGGAGFRCGADSPSSQVCSLTGWEVALPPSVTSGHVAWDEDWQGTIAVRLHKGRRLRVRPGDELRVVLRRDDDDTDNTISGTLRVIEMDAIKIWRESRDPIAAVFSFNSRGRWIGTGAFDTSDDDCLAAAPSL